MRFDGVRHLLAFQLLPRGVNAVVTLTAGQLLTLVNRTAQNDLTLDGQVGGRVVGSPAWITIETAELIS